MVLIDFLKKHKNSLLIGFCASTFFLSIAFIVLANLDALVLIGLITLLTPPGFSFALLGILILGSIIGALLWVGLNYLIDYINNWRLQRKVLLLRPEAEKEDQPTVWLREILVSSEDNTSTQMIALTNNSDSQTEILLSPESGLQAFSKEANQLLAKLGATISSQEDIEELSKCFIEFKKIYYQLAKKYHPDKTEPDKTIWSTQQFQELNAIYSKVKMKVDSKLSSLSQETVDGSAQEQIQLLKNLIALFKKHTRWLKKANKELEAIAKFMNDNLDKQIEEHAEEIKEYNEKIRKLNESTERNALGLAKNEELLKQSAKQTAHIDALADQVDRQQQVMLGVVKVLVREGKWTAPEGIDLEAFSTTPDDEEKNKNKTISFT